MSPGQLDRLRVPAALLLILIAAFVFWPRPSAEPASAGASPSQDVIVGVPGGEVIAESPTPAPTPIPIATLAPTPVPAVASTAPPPVDDAFTAEILVCRSINGGTCNERIERMPPNLGKFTALIRFTDAIAGDQLNAVLAGPAGTIAGTPYALQGGGDGYFWAEFQAGGLPSGDYVVTAVRNGQDVAATGFRKGG